MGHWWLMSFVDRHAMKGQRFRGIMVVEAERDSVCSAVLAAAARWPEVALWDPEGTPLPPVLVPPQHFRNRFLSTAPVDAEDITLVQQHVSMTVERLASMLKPAETHAISAISLDRGVAGLPPLHPHFHNLQYQGFGGTELLTLLEAGFAQYVEAPILPHLLEPVEGAPENIRYTHLWLPTQLGRLVKAGLEAVERKRMQGRMDRLPPVIARPGG